MLNFFLTLFALAIPISLWEIYKRWKKRPTFIYKDVKVWFIQQNQDSEKKKDVAKKRYIQKFGHADGWYQAFEPAPDTPEIRRAIKRGIDEFPQRLGWSTKGQGLKLKVTGYPVIRPKGDTGDWFTCHGCYYHDENLAYMTVMPKELGGLPATSTIPIHELGGHRQKYLEGFPAEHLEHTKHSDKAFWERIDSKVNLE